MDDYYECLQMFHYNLRDSAYRDIRDYLGREPTEEELEEAVEAYYDKFC